MPSPRREQGHSGGDEKDIKYISLFSGIEAATVAWEPLGWEPLAFCEIEDFPSAVLSYHYPDVPNLGDITQVDWKDVIERHGRPDVVVGGSPCQSFSVAGGRESLDGESALCFEYWRAIRDIRPTWLLWENVPGVFNTKDNAFGQFLWKLEELGYGLAWRVLDAQFVRVADRDGDGRIAGWFGPVAQRRRRVFLVGHLGAGGGAAAVLFESESVRGNTQTNRQKREELARAAGRGSAAGGSESLNGWDVQSKRIFSEDGTAPTLSSGTGEGANIQPSVLQSAGFCGYASHTAKSIGYAEEMAPTLKGNDWQCQVPDVLQATAIRVAQTSANGCGIAEELAHTVDTTQPEAVAFAIPENTINRPNSGTNGPMAYDNESPTLRASNDVPAVAFAQNTRDEVRLQGGDGQVTGPIAASGSAKGQGVPFVVTNYGEEMAGTLTRRADSSPSAMGGQNVVCMASGQANSEIMDDGTSPTITCLHEQPIVCMADDNQNAAVDENLSGTLKVGGGYASSSVLASNGEDVIGALCARDYKGVGNEYVGEGKVICQRAKS